MGHACRSPDVGFGAVYGKVLPLAAAASLTTSASIREQGELTRACSALTSEHNLSQREEEVLLYLCQGRTRAYIAETLYLSENTVRGHTQRIYGKLEVHNKTELQRKLGV